MIVPGAMRRTPAHPLGAADLAFHAERNLVGAESGRRRRRHRNRFLEGARIDEIEHQLAHAIAQPHGTVAFQPVALGAQGGVFGGKPLDDMALQIAHPRFAGPGLAESFRQKQAQQFAIFRELFAVHSYIRLHRLRGRDGGIAGLGAVVHAKIRIGSIMAFGVDHCESVTKV